jgi:RNA-splicing ligase RtcB
MLTIKGKYNEANVMIDDIDDTTRAQIQNFVNNPSFKGSYIAIMPDCHAGIGSCVGFTMQMNDRIIPDVVGVDLGCGMLSSKFDIENMDVVAFDSFIKENIPSGFSVNNNPCYVHDYLFHKIRNLASDIGMSKEQAERAVRAVGSLGGGNHFIEAGFGKAGKLWVTIHSGSRNFGLQIASYHTKKAKELCASWGADTQGMPFLLVDSPEGYKYLEDSQFAAEYASRNRAEMMRRISEYLHSDTVDSIESVHNYIGADGMIRKGATSAKLGERLIIPFNMRDGLAICVGKGSKKYNNSAPHGAGRILSRSKAKATLNTEQFQEDMRVAGVYTTTADSSTLDEAPGAYKDMQVILDNIKETVDVVEMIKPAYNFKAGESK